MQTTVAGIPCLVKYTITGSYRPAKISGPPEDCYEAEFPEVEFTVHDRKGYPAAWLNRKLTQEDIYRITDEILSYAEED